MKLIARQVPFILISIIILFQVSCTSKQKSNDSDSQKQAIELAENFLKENGYTDVTATKSNLTFEGLDSYESNIDSILIRRFNTLQPKAFCISEDSSRWDIGFLSAEVDVEKLSSMELQSDLPGRAVIVNKNGFEIRIAHKDPLFSKFRKLEY